MVQITISEAAECTCTYQTQL